MNLRVATHVSQLVDVAAVLLTVYTIFLCFFAA